MLQHNTELNVNGSRHYLGFADLRLEMPRLPNLVGLLTNDLNQIYDNTQLVDIIKG